jgi:hypothetical protein
MEDNKETPVATAKASAKTVRRTPNVQQTGRIVYNRNIGRWYAVSPNGTTLATGSKSGMTEKFPQFIVKE